MDFITCWRMGRLPNVGIFAVDKENADIIYKCAKYMVEHTALSQPAHRPLAWCRDVRGDPHPVRRGDEGLLATLTTSTGLPFPPSSVMS